MGEMKLQHLVITRLTIKLFYDEFSPDWLEERLRLFRTYCVPSMADQTSEDIIGTSGREAHNYPHRPRRIGLRPCDARYCWERGRARGQTQDVSTVGKFHGSPPGDARDRNSPLTPP